MLAALNAVILYILVQTLSERGASEFRWRILIIAAGAALAEAVLVHYLPGLLWALAILLAMVVLISAALVLWCATPRKEAVKIAAIYMCIRLAIGVILIIVLRVA